ncbi:MAG: hypothetical protein L0Z53_08745 [Acidobacteriales bacterium]|nr:hypothetical protein [Terriglobales bacterium]
MTAAASANQRRHKPVLTCSYLLLWLLLFAALAPAVFAATAADEPAAFAKTKQKSEPKLSEREVEELFQSLKSILDFVSDDTKYPIKHPVKHQMTSRDKVGEWISERLKDEQTAEKLESGELVSKKLGLLPRDFDLRSFYLDLMREQVAGFYNPKNKTMYLLDWMPLEQQRPVMAHELTHALQDQSFSLDEWLKAGKKEREKDKATDLDAGLDAIERDEREAARQALVEGQAMAVLLDYFLAPSQRNVLNSPVLVETMKQSMLEGIGSPVFQSAPLYMKEILAFPYKSGLSFVQELLLEGGKDRAYAAAMHDPPQTTREVMVPKSYLRREEMPPLILPKLNPILGGHYLRYDVGAIGQFDVDVFLKEFSGEKTAEKLAPEWRGGAYYALRKKSGSGERRKLTTADIALLYLSRWSTPEAARKFASAYAATLIRRYKFAQSHPSPDAGQVGPVTRWTTDEGPVLVEQQGTTVLVLESFEPEFMSKLRDAVFASQTETVPALAETAP